ncbi:MAG TPA: DUF4365 domain-containing protein [Myxococcota bacterium]|nr:DUF4365 domain-containing protein [Myxococcota bacterium]
MLIGPGETWQMEEFGEAYVRAVASVAGVTVDRPRVDNDSVDLRFSKRLSSGPIHAVSLEAQLKTTAADILRAGHLAFPLEMKNYDDLRPANVMVPRILIVVLVPPDTIEWLYRANPSCASKGARTGCRSAACQRSPTRRQRRSMCRALKRSRQARLSRSLIGSQLGASHENDHS